MKRFVKFAAVATSSLSFVPSAVSRKSFSLSFLALLHHSSNASEKATDFSVKVVGEKLMFSGYRNILRREVTLPTGRNVSFDIVDQKFPSIVVFNWDSQSCTCTLIKEYHPGPQRFIYGTVAGMYESKKHLTPLEAAQFELEEEAHLRTTQWFPLLSGENVTAPLDKYSTNHFYAYLALDCEEVEHPKPLDDEEFIIIERNVTYKKLTELVSTGQINVVSSYAILLGIRKLRELGIPLNKLV